MKHLSVFAQAQNEGENKFVFSPDRKACVVEVCADEGSSGVIAEIRIGNVNYIHFTDDAARALDLNNIRLPAGTIPAKVGQNVGIRVLDMKQGGRLRLTWETMAEEYPDPEPPELPSHEEEAPDSDLPASES